MFARIKQVLLVLIIAFCYSITIYSESRKVDTNYQSIDNYSKTTREPFKKLTFLCYIAADNDLAPFADRNLEQMATVGTNENINIIVHLDIRKKGDSSLRGKTKITKRLNVFSILHLIRSFNSILEKFQATILLQRAKL